MGEQFQDALALAARGLQRADFGEADDPSGRGAGLVRQGRAAQVEGAAVARGQFDLQCRGEAGIGRFRRGVGGDQADQAGERPAGQVLRRADVEQGLGLAVGDQHLAGQVGDQGGVGQAVQGVEHQPAQVARPLDGAVHEHELAVDDVGRRAAGPRQGRQQVGLAREGLQFLEHVGAGRLQPPPAPQRIDQQQAGQGRGRRQPDPAVQVEEGAGRDGRHAEARPHHQVEPRPEEQEPGQGQPQRRQGEGRQQPGLGRPDGAAGEQGVEQVGLQLDPGHDLGVVRQRRGVAVAQAIARGPHQHQLVAQEFGRGLAAQDVDEGDGAEVPRRAGERDQHRRLAHQGLPRRRAGGGRGQGLAGPGAPHELHQVRPGLGPVALEQIGAADDAVGVELDVHLAKARRRRPDRLDRRHQVVGRAVAARHLEGQRQEDGRAEAQGCGQGRVRRRIGVGLDQQHVIGDRPRTGLGQVLQQGLVPLARPGPAAQLGQAAVVDGDDDDLRFGRAHAQRGERVEHHIVRAVGDPAEAQEQDQGGGGQGDQRPFGDHPAARRPAGRPRCAPGIAQLPISNRSGGDHFSTCRPAAKVRDMTRHSYTPGGNWVRVNSCAVRPASSTTGTAAPCCRSWKR